MKGLDQPTKILVCEDEAGMREMLSVLLRRAGYAVESTAHLKEALSAVEKSEPYRLIITDLALPDGSGMELLSRARAKDEATQVIVITAYGTVESALEAMRRGAYDFVQKPFRTHELLVLVEKALEKSAIVSDNRLLRAALNKSQRKIIGQSPAMRRVLELIERAASAPSSVLITGESGTGKEMIARALHEASPRKDKPFVAINCAAMPESLIESELFGHEKGAFTGATTRKEGLFRAADGGTLFLDEIGELPLSVQAKLLRVLQERSVRPVGATQDVAVDVRVIAATNRSIEKEVALGHFRQDLFYRLNVIRIHLPPLRERREDIPLLAEHFLKKHATIQNKHLVFHPEVLRWLTQQTYPGNVRELENLIERAVALSRGPLITMEDIPMHPPATPCEQPPSPSLPELGEEGIDLDAWLGELERTMLLKAMEKSGGRQKAAARLLGMSFHAFRYRLKKHGLSIEESTPEDEK
ncbi:MAG: sigma-54 dependent transcriptional regulator [Deltaproteobacteria bacterium]|nr:sigma-54 dependent transcriptional regulator [Deltaproteobacteria bacterium]